MSKDEFVSRMTNDIRAKRKNAIREARCYQNDKNTRYLKHQKRQNCR